MNPQLTRHAQALVEQWRGDFIGVMQAMGDFSPEMVDHFEPPSASDGMLWWSQPFDLAPRAGIWIGASEQTWSALGRRILAAAGVESSGPAELKDTYLEVLRQSCGVLARSLGGKLEREIAVSGGAEQAPADDLAFGCQISIGMGEEELPRLAFHINLEMLEALEKSNHLNAAPESSQAEPEAGDGEKGSEFSNRACGTLDLLLDVEMPISVSFGRTQVRIQNVLKLISGSIIELDRAISEPVEVIVNNCIIARGEVVVVDGNYGVRINEVMSRKERLQESRKYLLPASSIRR
jgi:flagellar motor switch protein FliN/FliY